MFSHLAEFAKRVKLSGTAEELESFRYLQALLGGYGYVTRLIQHDAYISLPGRALVEVAGETPAARSGGAACAFAFGPGTRTGAIQAPPGTLTIAGRSSSGAARCTSMSIPQAPSATPFWRTCRFAQSSNPSRAR